MTDRLKEIRDKHVTNGRTIYVGCTEDEVKQIQSETYQLGRQEVIEEIERLCQPSTPICESNLGMESFKKVILAALDTLNSTN